MNPSLIVDVANFAIGFQHYVTERPIGTAGSNPDVVRKGMRIFLKLNQRIMPGLLEDVGAFIRDNSIGNLRPFFESARRGSPQDPERVVRVGTLFGRLIRRVVAQPALLEAAFGDDPESKRKIRRLYQAYSATSGQGLQQQSLIPSKIIMVRNWVRDAVRDLGVEPPVSDALQTDIESARELGRDLQQIKRLGEPRLEPDAQALVKKIKTLADSSTDPETVLEAGFNPNKKTASLTDLWGEFWVDSGCATISPRN